MHQRPNGHGILQAVAAKKTTAELQPKGNKIHSADPAVETGQGLD